MAASSHVSAGLISPHMAASAQSVGAMSPPPVASGLPGGRGWRRGGGGRGERGGRGGALGDEGGRGRPRCRCQAVRRRPGAGGDQDHDERSHDGHGPGGVGDGRPPPGGKTSSRTSPRRRRGAVVSGHRCPSTVPGPPQDPTAPGADAAWKVPAGRLLAGVRKFLTLLLVVALSARARGLRPGAGAPGADIVSATASRTALRLRPSTSGRSSTPVTARCWPRCTAGRTARSCRSRTSRHGHPDHPGRRGRELLRPRPCRPPLDRARSSRTSPPATWSRRLHDHPAAREDLAAVARAEPQPQAAGGRPAVQLERTSPGPDPAALPQQRLLRRRRLRRPGGQELYFDKDVGELGWGEAAMLASLIQNPVGYDPCCGPSRRRSVGASPPAPRRDRPPHPGGGRLLTPRRCPRSATRPAPAERLTSSRR